MDQETQIKLHIFRRFTTNFRNRNRQTTKSAATVVAGRCRIMGCGSTYTLGKALFLSIAIHQTTANFERKRERAAISVALNIGEGAVLRGAAKKRLYAIARGSVVEVAAALELVSDIGDSVPLEHRTA